MSPTAAAEASRLNPAKREIRSVPIGQMFVDPRYQRHLKVGRAQDIADHFDWSAFGVPVLSRRDDGRYAEVDCQHRIEAAKLIGLGDAEPMCEVFEGLTVAEEAALFRDRNNMEKVPLVDRFRARLVAGEERALDMMRILDRHGWKLQASSSGPGYFAAIGKLEKLYNASPLAAERTIAVLTRSWGYDPIAASGLLVDGLGRVFVRFGGQVEIDDLVDRLSRFPGGASSFLGQARGLQPIIGGTVGRAVGEKVIDLYNVRRKKTALPSLRSPQHFSQDEDAE